METKDQQEPGKEVVEQTQTESTPVEESKFVSDKAYKEVSSDMHKYKSGLKEERARTAELEAKLSAIEENQMKEQKRYEELYEREKAERVKEQTERNKEKELYVRSIKVSALKDVLGGKVKDEYLSFANVDSIELKEDGTLSSESVQSVANTFRQAHPGLIAKDSAVNITGTAPANGVSTEQPPTTLGNMSTEQKIAQLEEMKRNRS